MSSTGWQQAVYDVIKASGIRLIGYVPDAGHTALINSAKQDDAMQDVVMTTEEEGIPLCAGAWLGGMVGLSRENYKLEPFHEEIEAGRYLIMVDVRQESKARVREIMNMGFPRVRFCGKDSTMINPFKSPKHVYPQTTH